MALTIAEGLILDDFGQKIVDQLKKDIKTKKVTKYGAVNASGALERSVRYEIYQEGLRVYAFDYIYYLEHGRGPTKKSGDGSLKDKIRDWIDDKGITPDGITKDTLAFLIARKIHREGTTIFQQGGTDLISSIVSEKLINDIATQMSATLIQEISSDIINALTLKEAV